ncbi:MAG: hypothetical protein WDO13_01115 [Verrucomicrobiota bacterium]
MMVIQKRQDDARNLATAQQDKHRAEQTVAETKSQLTDVQAAKAKDDTDLSAANTKIEDLQNQLTTANKNVTDAQAAVDKANTDAKAAQAKVDDLNSQLGGQTPQQYKDAVDKATKDLAAAQAEQKILQDQLQASQQQVADLQGAINRSKTGSMPGVSGKVTFVDRTWNFVVLDVGLSAGVVPNGELIVYRGKSFLGKVRVTRVDPNDSVAEILPDIKGDIQVGDSVLN